jgi:hypothetical protein
MRVLVIGLIVCLIGCVSGYGSLEHKTIGNTGEIVILENDGNNNPVFNSKAASSYSFTNEQNVLLGSYGDIVAMGGDFFGARNADEVICASSDPSTKFYNMFTQMWDSMNSAYVNRILAEFNYEQQVLDENPNVPPHEAFDKIPTSRFFDVYDSRSEYLRLLLYNFDHFTSCAVEAYTAGHTYALNYARSGSALLSGDFSTLTPDLRASRITRAARILETAYAMNAFAEHFLTDRFAAGHVRTPRREISEICSDRGEDFKTGDLNDLGAAGLAAMWMHDEDNINGLLVANKRGDVYVTYGDYSYFDVKNAEARPIVTQAIVLSRQEILDAFRGNTTTNFAALDLIPEPTLYETRFAINNTCPLFRVEDNNNVAIRREGSVRPTQWYTEQGRTGQGCTYDRFVERSCNSLIVGVIFDRITDNINLLLSEPQPGTLTFSTIDDAWVSERPAFRVQSSSSAVRTTPYLILIVSVLLMMTNAIFA